MKTIKLALYIADNYRFKKDFCADYGVRADKLSYWLNNDYMIAVSNENEPIAVLRTVSNLRLTNKEGLR